ncbi:EamA family transporter [Scytonema hofmannii FACHB-248]|uniref:EamA family transporter n=1 Tax=Scytonema hofmannii FACHB-248 TaxID=1842502 RepID=A0ABR8GUQ4_9CYAN|nr:MULTISPECIES: EamA family transporter [Nostocales]MBD2606897.1 EamA family transporter [Scytonema hofmannii FACHB-248]
MISEASNPRLRLIAYITLLASILFGTTGQLLMKKTMSNHAQELFTWLFLLQLMLALSVYSIGVVNWILALRFWKLSIAYPLTSLNYVGILLGSYYFFDEKLTPLRIIGVVLVFIGILFVVIPVKNHKRI